MKNIENKTNLLKNIFREAILDKLIYIDKADMEKEIDEALKDNRITLFDANITRERIKSLKSYEEFKKDLHILQQKCVKLLGLEEKSEINFHEDQIFAIWKALSYPWTYRADDKDENEFALAIYHYAHELKEFFEKYNIDGVHNGEPWINIYDIKIDVNVDKAHRYSAIISIPLLYDIKVFREKAEKKYSILREKFKKARFDFASRKKWGERSGKREYIRKRNERIIKKYLWLKERGMTDTAAINRIHEEFELFKDMTDSMSIFPIIRKYKKLRSSLKK